MAICLKIMINLLFFGDFVCQEPGKLKFSNEVSSLVSASDVIYCNCEAPIQGAGSPIAKSGPALTQSPESPNRLEEAGFNLIGLANNHMMDMGVGGYEATINGFYKAVTLGAGKKGDVYAVKKLEIGGSTFGFLSLTHKEFGTLNDEASDDEQGTAWINSSAVNRSIIKAKETCDYLFVLPHAGVENVDVPLPEWRFRYREFIDLGTDAVIASHPHVPQGWEEYNGKLIYYSLGNFIFDSFSNTHGSYWNKGLGVKITIEDDGKISYETLNVKYENHVLDIDNSARAVEHNQYLCSLLTDTKAYNEVLERALDTLWRDEYQLYLLRGLGSVSMKTSKNTFIHSAYGLLKGMDIPMLLNNFQCESHRWAIERILRNKMK